MNKNELYKKLAYEEKEAGKAQITRAVLAFIGYAVGFFLIFHGIEDPKGSGEIIDVVILAVVTAGINLLISAVVFNWLFERRRIEQKRIETIKGEISELEKKERNEQIKKN